MALDIRIRFGRAIRRVVRPVQPAPFRRLFLIDLLLFGYSGIECGVRNVSLVNIERIAKGLEKSLPDLFRRV